MDADIDPYGDSYTKPYRHAHSNGYSDADTHPHCDGYSDGGRDTDQIAFAHQYANRNIHAHPDCDSNEYTDAYGDADANHNSNVDKNTDTNSHPYGHSLANDHLDPYAYRNP